MIKTLSYLILILFCWIIYPYKWGVKLSFLRSKHKAVIKAEKMYSALNKTVYVVQWGKTFYVGVRSQCRKLDRAAAKHLGLTHQEHKLWDYRNCVVYKTK